MASPAPKGFVTEAEYQRVVKKINDLSRNYRELEAKYEAKSKELHLAKAETAAAKQRSHQWKLWVDHNKEKIWPTKTNGDSRPVSIPPKDDARPAVSEIPSSQTTDDEPLVSSPAANHPSSEDVEVVSARPVKRRRGNREPSIPRPGRVKPEPNSPENPIEFGSSDLSPELQRRGAIMRTQTSDLDALVSRIKTPRRRREDRAVSEDQTRPRMLLPGLSSLSEGEEPRDDASHDAEGDSIHEVDQGRGSALRPRDGAANERALRQLSSNVPHGAATRANTKRKRGSRESVREKIALMSEDGEMQPSQNAAAATTKQSLDPKVTMRLGSLLDGITTPERAPVLQRHTPQTVIRRTHKRGIPALPPEANDSVSSGKMHNQDRLTGGHEVTSRRIKVESDTSKVEGNAPMTAVRIPATANGRVQKQALPSPIRHSPRYQRPRGLEKSPPPPDPEEEPLRLRPLQALHLSDFKINPANFGTDFAFADTLRGRDQRRCLQGCTRPDCCGKAFKAAIESGAIKTDGTDAEVLAEYIGPDWRSHVRGFTAEKRKDMILSARAWTFGNKHGKHRTAYERARSPPGFWRTDMPTTQEAEEDRNKAREMESEKVEERWREALRPDGRWLFRDES